MAVLTQKVQVLLTDEQYQALLGLAEIRGKRLSELLREEIVERLLAETRRAAKQKAFDEITAMDLPVADWSEMEDEIERAHIEPRPAS